MGGGGGGRARVNPPLQNWGCRHLLSLGKWKARWFASSPDGRKTFQLFQEKSTEAQRCLTSRCSGRAGVPSLADMSRFCTSLLLVESFWLPFDLRSAVWWPRKVQSWSRQSRVCQTHASSTASTPDTQNTRCIYVFLLWAVCITHFRSLYKWQDSVDFIEKPKIWH